MTKLSFCRALWYNRLRLYRIIKLLSWRTTMAFRINSQIELSPFFGSCWQLSKYQEEQLKKTWAYYYSEKVFPKINEERFNVLYSKNQASRPNTPYILKITCTWIRETHHAKTVRSCIITGLVGLCENNQLGEKKWSNLATVKPRRYWPYQLCTKNEFNGFRL